MPFDGAFSPLHWLIVGGVALLVLSPEQLPQAARQLGRGIREFRKLQQHLRVELRDIVHQFDLSDSRSGSDAASRRRNADEVDPEAHASE